MLEVKQQSMPPTASVKTLTCSGPLCQPLAQEVGPDEIRE